MDHHSLTEMFRPCNQAELNLVSASGNKKWPPRLPEQPIFYPVTNLDYARRINEWNVAQFGSGYITRFFVNSSFLEAYKIETVGDSQCTEWWIPAEDLESLNENIVGLIEVVEQS